MLTVRATRGAARNLLRSRSGGTDGSWAAGGDACRAAGCSRNICTLGVVVFAWEEADGRGLFALLLVVSFRESLRGMLVSYS